MINPWKTIAHCSTAEIKDLQNKKLHSFINHYVYPFSSYYRNLFDKNKIDPRKIKTIDDLRRIPFSTKLDLIDQENSVNRYKEFIFQPSKEKIQKYWPFSKQIPLGLTSLIKGEDFVLDALEKEYRPVFLTYTTGTTNKPTPFLYTNFDIQNLYQSGARMLNLFDVPQDSRILNVFPYAPHLAFWQVVFGGFAACILTLSTGGGKTLGTDGNIKAIMKMQPSVILGVPSFIYHVLREAKDQGCRMEFVQKVVLGASRVTPGFKLKLAELLQSMGAKDVFIMGTYGFTEARCAWAETLTPIGQSSGYYLYPDKEIFEVVDPKTGEVKAEGEDGELIYTSIDSRGSVVLRYRTGDFVKGGIIYSPCPIKKWNIPRMSSDITRLSDVKDLQLSKIKGALVNLNHFSSVLNDLASIDEWQIELRKKNNDPYDVDELVVYICPKENCDKSLITSDIQKNILSLTEVSPNEVKFIGMAEMVKRLEIETANKEKRILDSRPKDAV